jgi:secondary thiamine-phosphate synthase enzyme
MKKITIKSDKRDSFILITEKVQSVIPKDYSGTCTVFVPHTTAAVTINENADPDVRYDIINFLDKAIPWNEELFNHLEGNSAAHIKASLLGLSETIIVENGKLQLGTWQGIYFCEFDGPRTREFFVNLT